MVVTRRLDIKSRVQAGTATKQDKISAEALKIVANAGFFGKFGSEYSWLRDIKALVSVTFNGELNLLMLIERLEESNFHVISANTDGITTRIEKVRLQEYYDICRSWEIDTNISLEFVTYLDYCRTTVNDYYSISDKGKLKTKGDLSDKLDISKAYMHPIVPIAIKKFFIEKIPIEVTLHDPKYDIYDFCMSIKTGKNYINEFHKIVGSELQVTKLQKTIRYYVSKRGGTLIKRDKNDNSLHQMVKGYTVKIFNDFYPVDNISEYEINYNYYKMKCMDIIDTILGNITVDLKKGGGSLFD
jgi:DNA polymerase elongation subunit (family B)